MFALITFISWSVFALQTGTYTSYDLKLKDLQVESFGNGVKLTTCADFDSGQCFNVEAVLYPEGQLWGGRGHLYMKYGSTQCQYDTEFKILQKEDTLKVDYYGPSFLPGRYAGCPPVRVVKPKWFALENEFVLQPPCYPNPIFENTRCF